MCALSPEASSVPLPNVRLSYFARQDLDRTCEIIRKHSFSQMGNRTSYTFAIENPCGKLQSMPCIVKLIDDPQIRACVVRLDQCRFGSFRSGKMMGYFNKVSSAGCCCFLLLLRAQTNSREAERSGSATTTCRF